MTKGRKAPPTPAALARVVLDGKPGGTLDALIWHGNPDARRLSWGKVRITHTTTPAPDGPPMWYGFPVIIDDTGTLPEDSIILVDDATIQEAAKRMRSRRR